MSNTTRTKDARPQMTEARPQITAVGLTALILGFLLALIATWAISGRAAASDDGLVGADAAVGVVAGLPASDGAAPASCAPTGDGTSNGTGATSNGTGATSNGTGATSNGTGGTGDGSGTGDGTDGNGDGGGTAGTPGYLVDIFAGARAHGTDGALNGGLFPGISTWRNLVDARVLAGADGLVEPTGGNRWLDHAGTVVIGGHPQGSPSLIAVDGNLFAVLGR